MRSVVYLVLWRQRVSKREVWWESFKDEIRFVQCSCVATNIDNTDDIGMTYLTSGAPAIDKTRLSKVKKKRAEPGTASL